MSGVVGPDGQMVRGAPVAAPAQVMVQIIADCGPDPACEVLSCGVAGHRVSHTKGGIALAKPEIAPFNEAQIWSFTLEMMRNRMVALGATDAELAVHAAYALTLLQIVPSEASVAS